MLRTAFALPGWILAGRICRALLAAALLGTLAASAAEEPAKTLPAGPAVADPIEGVWLGTITAPQGTVADIGFEFFRTKHGTLVFRMNFPGMFTYAVPFMIPVETDGHGSYAITPAFNIRLRLDGARLSGTFGLGQLPLELKRGGQFPPKPVAPQYPAAPTPLWKFALGAGTWAPPVVADNTIYLGTSAGQFHAVHAADGTAAWTWQGAHGIDGRAVVNADTVYFVDTRMNLIALNRTDGTLCWQTPLHDEQLAGQPAPDNPTFNHRAATPLILDGVIYCGSSDGGLYALDAVTGAKLWRHDARAPVFSGVGRHGADTLMFGTMDGSVVLLDRRTRRETLRVKTGGGVVTTPVVAAGRLVVGSRDYLLYGFNLADGSLAWKFSYWFSWIESTPVPADDGLLYVGASDYSRVTALDPATGRARWATPVHGMNWGSPLVIADRVFTGTASQNIEGTAIAHTGGIMALDRATGAVLWQLPAAPAPAGGFGGYAGSLALAGDKVIAAGFDGQLIALPAR
ncbi:MAG: PQQ-like beta-propeller repeat protein [Opitutae bacterium]|nr:PQQ-like beta-propeller repeat protein [Opitutae bacterium]